MKIEPGMFVRTDKGTIGKFIQEVNYYFELEYQGGLYDLVYKNRCLKASYDLYELIEKDDVIVVDGIKYTVLKNKKYFYGNLYIERITKEGCPRITSLSHLICDSKIQAIVTKEQFEREKYTIGDD